MSSQIAGRVAVWATIVLIVIGCTQSGERRRHRRDNDGDEQKIVKPLAETAGMGLAQRTQVLGRAQGLREIASQCRNGELKTLWDIRLAFQKMDHQARAQFDADVGAQMQHDLSGGSNDNAPSDAADKFEHYAIELEGLLK